MIGHPAQPDVDLSDTLPAGQGARAWSLPGGSAPRYRQLYALIRQRLARGELRDGDRLPDERRLAWLCGVSRTTVRGAMALLGDEGLVRRRTRVGTIICRAAPGELDGEAGLHVVWQPGR